MKDSNMTFEQDKINRLKTLFKDRFPAMAEEFLHYMESDLAQIKKLITPDAVSPQNRNQIASIAHMLKSRSGQFGMVEVAPLAGSLERQAQQASPAMLTSLHYQMLSAFIQAAYLLRGQMPPVE